MTMPAVGPMGVGEILDRAFQILRAHFGTLFLTALIGTAPYMLLYAVLANPALEAGSADASAAFLLTFVTIMALVGLATAVVWGALAHQVQRAVTGGTVTVPDGLRHGIRALLRLLGAGLMVYLLLFALMIPVGLIGLVVVTVAALAFGEGMAAVLLSSLGIGVPVAILAVGWVALTFLVLPVVTVERAGPVRAITRSNQLARGGRPRVFITAFVAWLVILLPAIGLPYLLGISAAVWDPATVETVSSTRLLLYQATSFLVGGVTTPFLVATMVFAYFDRRVRREGYDVEAASAALGAEA